MDQSSRTRTIPPFLALNRACSSESPVVGSTPPSTAVRAQRMRALVLQDHKRPPSSFLVAGASARVGMSLLSGSTRADGRTDSPKPSCMVAGLVAPHKRAVSSTAQGHARQDRSRDVPSRQLNGKRPGRGSAVSMGLSIGSPPSSIHRSPDAAPQPRGRVRR